MLMNKVPRDVLTIPLIGLTSGPQSTPIIDTQTCTIGRGEMGENCVSRQLSQELKSFGQIV